MNAGSFLYITRCVMFSRPLKREFRLSKKRRYCGRSPTLNVGESGTSSPVLWRKSSSPNVQVRRVSMKPPPLGRAWRCRSRRACAGRARTSIVRLRLRARSDTCAPARSRPPRRRLPVSPVGGRRPACRWWRRRMLAPSARSSMAPSAARCCVGAGCASAVRGAPTTAKARGRRPQRASDRRTGLTKDASSGAPRERTRVGRTEDEEGRRTNAPRLLRVLVEERCAGTRTPCRTEEGCALRSTTMSSLQRASMVYCEPPEKK